MATWAYQIVIENVGLILLGAYLWAFYQDFGKGKPFLSFLKFIISYVLVFGLITVIAVLLIKNQGLKGIMCVPIILMVWVLFFNKHKPTKNK